MWKHLHVTYPLFLPDFNETWIFSTDFREQFKYQVSSTSVQRKPSSMRAERQSDGQRDITRLIVAFRSFSNAPKNWKMRCTLPETHRFTRVTGNGAKMKELRRFVGVRSLLRSVRMYSRSNSTKSPASSACNVSETRLMQPVGRVREVVCA